MRRTQAKKAPSRPPPAPRVPIPRKVAGRLLQAKVPPELFAAAQAEARRQNRSVRDVVEWGLKEFLAHSAPQEARRLGIAFKS